MIVLATSYQPAVAIAQPMNGCALRVLDRYFTAALTDCIWIVPGTFAAFA